MDKDWLIYVGESEGLPLLVMLDKAHGKDFSDRARPWAIMVELRLPRTDGNALPPQDDWPALEAVEAALVRDLATDEDDWTYVVRTFGEGVARFCFYARRSSAAAARVGRTLAEFDGQWDDHRVLVQSDPTWSAYRAFFPADEKGPDAQVAPSFRDQPPYELPNARPSPGATRWSGREDQPWRGEESQAHPEE